MASNETKRVLEISVDIDFKKWSSSKYLSTQLSLYNIIVGPHPTPSLDIEVKRDYHD